MEKNNTDGIKNIKNDQQKKLYDDFVRMNTFLASMFLYLYDCFYYESFPITALKDNGAGLTEYAKYGSNGIPPAQIIDEIKLVYPYLNNLMMKLLCSYNEDTIPEVKTKKLPEIKLKTKKKRFLFKKKIIYKYKFFEKCYHLTDLNQKLKVNIQFVKFKFGKINIIVIFQNTRTLFDFIMKQTQLTNCYNLMYSMFADSLDCNRYEIIKKFKNQEKIKNGKKINKQINS